MIHRLSILVALACIALGCWRMASSTPGGVPSVAAPLGDRPEGSPAGGAAIVEASTASAPIDSAGDRWSRIGETGIYVLDAALATPVWAKNCSNGTYQRVAQQLPRWKSALKGRSLSAHNRAAIQRRVAYWDGLEEQWWYSLCVATIAPSQDADDAITTR